MTVRSITASFFLSVTILTGWTWGQAKTEPSETKIPPKERFQLFLLVGQSNMAGRGKVEDQDTKPHPRVLMLNKENKWVPAVDPMHFDKPGIVGVGLGRTFGLEIAKANPDITVGLIPCAVGGSPISVWEPGKFYSATKSHPYDDALRRAQVALKDGTLKGILWHQGESDSNPKDAPQYAKRLLQLIERFRDDLHAPEVPFIAGQMGQFKESPWNEAKKHVDADHRQLPENVPQTAFVSSDGLTHKGDKVHFNAESYRELGKRYAKAYQSLTTEEKTDDCGESSETKTSKNAAKVIDIGSRRELFLERGLVEDIQGAAELFVHEPTPGDVVLTTDKPWEGNTCAYYSLFQDGDLYRMYYRGSHYDVKTRKGTHPEVTCYAESKDGIHWTKPNLGLFEWDGSKDNNIVLMGLGTHCFVAFRDDNPDCKPEARYKGISRGRPEGKKGLYVFQSPDGLRWKLIKNEPVITQGAFDSQNLAFWDPVSGLYVDYHRTFTNGVRSIMTCTSKDFVNWTGPVSVQYGPDTPNQHLYTNAVRPYPRAPHIRIGFPTRYIPKGSQVEPVFMASRDGVNFTRYEKPIIPRTAPKDRDGNRSNYMAHGLLELPGKPKEYSVYGTEAYYSGPDSRLRRFIYRVDGFVSLRAKPEGGELITKPIIFAGDRLSLNFETRNKGQLQVELQDLDGQPIKSFTLADCQPLQGDEVDQTVTWKNADLAPLAGRPVRLRFVLKDGDLYSYQFQSAKSSDE